MLCHTLELATYRNEDSKSVNYLRNQFKIKLTLFKPTYNQVQFSLVHFQRTRLCLLLFIVTLIAIPGATGYGPCSGVHILNSIYFIVSKTVKIF